MDAKQCYNIITTHIQQEAPEREEISQWVEWYNSDAYETRLKPAVAPDGSGFVGADSDEDSVNVETNFTFAWIDTMTANVCPLNPQVTFTSGRKDFKAAAAARERLINATFKMDDAHDLAVDFATHVGIAGRGVTKVVWNATLARPEASSIEPSRFFYDRTVPYKKARYVCEVTLITKEEMESRLAINSKRADGSKYNAEVAKDVHYGAYPEWFTAEQRAENISSFFQWAVVYEFWDLSGGKYYHFLHGNEEPLLEGPLPYKHIRNPFVVKFFNRSLKHHGGLSDVKLIARNQEQLNEVNSLQLTHAYKSIPFTVVNSALIDEPDEFLAAIEGVNKPGAVVELKANNVRNISDVVSYTQTPGLTPAFESMKRELKEGINFTLAFAAHERGQTGDSKLATELSMMQDGLQTRNGRRVKVMEKWIVEVAYRYLGLWRQFLKGQAPALSASGDVSEALDATELGFDRPLEPGEEEKDWWFTCKPVPFDPAENNRLVQLRSIQQFFPVLNGNPAVDQQKLVHKLLDLLGLSDLGTDVVPPAAAPPGAMQQQGGGAQNLPVAPGAGGQLPPNVGVDRSDLLVAGKADQPGVK